MRFIVVALLVLVSASGLSAAEQAVLIVHGGVGVLSEEEMKAEGQTRADYEKAIAQALAAGWKALQKQNAKGSDGVEAAIRVLEDSPLFNAGKGAALTRDGRAELDAAIMEGTMVGQGQGKRDPRKRAGAVTGVTHVRNPISAAKAVMEMEGSRHVLLAGSGAEDFVLNDVNRKKYLLERVDNQYFWTDRRLKQIRPAGEQQTQRLGHDRFVGTVGAVAVVRESIVAGTSTGGLANKWPGRIGDSPLIGAGTYADDRACGVSCTGTGEVFIRHGVAHDVAARMLYKKIPVEKAAEESIRELPDEEGGVGGLIALDTKGNSAFITSPKCDGMYRGYVTANGDIYVAIFRNEVWKKQ